MEAIYDIDAYRAALDFVAREEPAPPLPERVIQQFWYDYGVGAGPFQTLEGHQLDVLSPGWWNHCAGPDFQGAQLRFNGTLYNGDVEIHLDQACWWQHGHDQDKRYNNVLLHVLLHPPPNDHPVVFTASGRSLPHLCIERICEPEEGTLRPLVDVETNPELAPRCHGSCNRFVAEGRPELLTDFLGLSGEWRLLNKTRYVQQRMAKVGAAQAVYELLARALGYQKFAEDFERLACALPYERAVQLVHREPFLLEATLLHLAGLLPRDREEGEALSPHVQRLATLRREHFSQLNDLPIQWHYAGVRPNNYPGRRIAGLAFILGRTARDGLLPTLERIWVEHSKPVEVRRAFERLFPPAMGFWATHYRVDRDAMPVATAPVGQGRVRSIIGNVFVPVALALARERGQRSWEDQVLQFYRALPMEPDNHIYKRMLPRILGDHSLRFNFQTQQGVLQLHEDWCKSNPSCKDCSLLAYLAGRARTDKT